MMSWAGQSPDGSSVLSYDKKLADLIRQLPAEERRALLAA